MELYNVVIPWHHTIQYYIQYCTQYSYIIVSYKIGNNYIVMVIVIIINIYINFFLNIGTFRDS